MSFIEKVKTWIEWLRTNFTPKAWKEVYEASKALFELSYTFLYFFVYPFVESSKAFWFNVLKPFWSHRKVGWARLVNKVKILWKELLDVFKKDKEVIVDEPELPEDPWG